MFCSYAKSFATHLVFKRMLQYQLGELVDECRCKCNYPCVFTDGNFIQTFWKINHNTELTQLITMHGNIGCYLHMMGINNSLECECGHDCEDTEHMPFYCQKHDLHRMLLKIEMQPVTKYSPQQLKDFFFFKIT